MMAFGSASMVMVACVLSAIADRASASGSDLVDG
jgi:hypothetical protein